MKITRIIGIGLLVVAISILSNCYQKEMRMVDPLPFNYGVEIYLTKQNTKMFYLTDYTTINLDTIELEAKPYIKYADILYYDTTQHIIGLRYSHHNLSFDSVAVLGRMFVVTLNGQAQYCGFLWAAISSIPCNWVFMEEPIDELITYKQNEVQLKLMYPQTVDPRCNPEIFARLKADGKAR